VRIGLNDRGAHPEAGCRCVGSRGRPAPAVGSAGDPAAHGSRRADAGRVGRAAVGARACRDARPRHPRPVRQRLQRPHRAIARRGPAHAVLRAAPPRMASRPSQGRGQPGHDPQGAHPALEHPAPCRREWSDRGQPAVARPSAESSISRRRTSALTGCRRANPGRDGRPAPGEVEASKDAQRTRRSYTLPASGTPQSRKRDAVIVHMPACDRASFGRCRSRTCARTRS
jgi:hypothetical protein